MCLIACAINSHPAYRLVLVANRDEFRDRVTEPAGFLPDAPHLLAGRDRLAGGTWIGVTMGQGYDTPDSPHRLFSFHLEP